MTNVPDPTTVIKKRAWWGRRTQLERTLCLATSCSVIVTALMLIAMALLLHSDYRHSSNTLPEMSSLRGGCNKTGTTSKPSFKGSEDDICYSDACVHTASEILEKMNLQEDPCDDFYRFVCGKFIQKSIPDEKVTLNTFSTIGDKLTDQLRTVIKAPYVKGEPAHFRYTKNIYRLCMNKTDVEARGTQDVHSLLSKLGGWPVLEGDSWNMGAFDWRQTVYGFRREGFSVDYLIDFSVTFDSKNSTSRIIEIDTATLALSREYLTKGLSHRITRAYYEYMVDIAVLFGADRERASKELLDSLQLEMRLANISLPLEQRRNATKLYNPTTVEEMELKYQSIPWREYISTLLEPSVSLRPNEKIIITVPEYISGLEKILASVEKRTLANYLLWRAASSTVSYLPNSFRERQLKYSTVLSGRTEREPRWKECVSYASAMMSQAVGSLYIRQFFKEQAKKDAVDLVERVRSEMVDILENVDWMDNDTRKNALEKAKTMTAHIAYPDELLDDNKLAQFYNGLVISDQGPYLDAMLNVSKFGIDLSFRKLRQPVNKTDWITHSSTAQVNAFYSSIENSIQFPAGILQGTFFGSDKPKYMNFGSIGYVIGHEITHGFDDQGRQFDKDGNLRDWWDPETKKAYLEKAKCVIEQYGNYTHQQVKLNLNGINTQGENIADNGGVKEAYRAYLKWRQEFGPEPRLPGLQRFTNQQMFWISAASSWCMASRDEYLRNRITTGFHSPGEFRVRGPLSNRPEFASDFSCPLGCPMNPPNKCQVW